MPEFMWEVGSLEAGSHTDIQEILCEAVSVGTKDNLATSYSGKTESLTTTVD